MSHAEEIIQRRRADDLADACMSGHDYAQSQRLPDIPEKWRNPSELRSTWIDGFLTELRNRIEAVNDD